MNIQQSVQDRYAEGAQEREAALCCPVNYDPRFLKVIPEEVLERDYGCGDPSTYVREGDVVLDLGSGGGKICFIASQVVGEKGRVIGVDMTPDMLDLARRSAPLVAEKTGFNNVEFKRGHIEDLKTDLDLVDAYLADNAVKSVEDLELMQHKIEKLQADQPMIADNSVDVIVSNCVLNLVADVRKDKLFAEMFRVLKVGGRIAISDIVSDEASPQHLKDDEKLWSGCISGALTETGFLEALEDAGFHGITIDKYEDEPWQIVEGIEFRSVTVLAWKGDQGADIEKNQAVIYPGPWKQVEDDDGQIFYRGERMAVSERNFNILTSEPYSEQMVAVPSATPVETEEDYNLGNGEIRHPAETKQGKAKITSDPDQGGSCC